METTEHANDCLHCAVNRVIDAHNERKHLATGEPVNVDHVIADLMAVAAEMIAFYDDPKARKFVLKRAQNDLAILTRERRTTGRYPGGHGQTPISGEMQ
jgi:hypothetical protein